MGSGWAKANSIAKNTSSERWCILPVCIVVTCIFSWSLYTPYIKKTKQGGIQSTSFWFWETCVSSCLSMEATKCCNHTSVPNAQKTIARNHRPARSCVDWTFIFKGYQRWAQNLQIPSLGTPFISRSLISFSYYCYVSNPAFSYFFRNDQLRTSQHPPGILPSWQVPIEKYVSYDLDRLAPEIVALIQAMTIDAWHSDVVSPERWSIPLK